MITESELHAFVDGELAYEERADVIQAAEQLVSLRAQLNELQQLKELVRASYRDIEYPGDDILQMTSWL